VVQKQIPLRDEDLEITVWGLLGKPGGLPLPVYWPASMRQSVSRSVRSHCSDPSYLSAMHPTLRTMFGELESVSDLVLYFAVVTMAAMHVISSGDSVAGDVT
jgi:hypothetical protein